MAGVRQGWKTGGVVKGAGIPAPSGQYRVGCVDLMHQLEGDDRGLLVRLYYPTEATPEAGYTYSHWYPHKNYVRGLLQYIKVKPLRFMTWMIGGLTGKGSSYSCPFAVQLQDLSTAPKIPALEGSPLFGSKGEAAGTILRCYSDKGVGLGSDHIMRSSDQAGQLLVI